MNKLYLILFAIIIALAFNAGALSTEAKVSLSNSEINSANSAANQAESLETRISSNELQSQGFVIDKNDVNIYLHKAIYVLTVLLSALIICMLIALQNDMFFLRKKEQKIKESYEFEVYLSDK